MSIIPHFFIEATVALGRNTLPSPQWYATGFVVGRYEGAQDSVDKFSTYLITNKHVVDNEKKMVMQVNLQDGVKAYLLELLDKDNATRFSAHPSADVIPSYDFCREMYHKTGAFVTPGDCFEQPHSFRVGYACSKQELISGLAAVTEYLNTL